MLTLAEHSAGRYSARVVLSESELPMHATASGIAVPGFVKPSFRQVVLKKLKRCTQFTHTGMDQLELDIQAVLDSGFGTSDQGFESGVHGMAAPLFDLTGKVAGAVACVASREDDALIKLIKTELIAAATDITRSRGGTIPENSGNLWTGLLPLLAVQNDPRRGNRP